MLEENLFDQEIKKKKRQFFFLILLLLPLAGGMAVLSWMEDPPVFSIAAAEGELTASPVPVEPTAQPTAVIAGVTPTPASPVVSPATATPVPQATPESGEIVSPTPEPGTPTPVLPSELPVTGAPPGREMAWVLSGLTVLLLGALLYGVGETLRDTLFES